jgi:hypothetical protein
LSQPPQSGGSVSTEALRGSGGRNTVPRNRPFDDDDDNDDNDGGDVMTVMVTFRL